MGEKAREAMEAGAEKIKRHTWRLLPQIYVPSRLKR